jgi:hypothetical protein
MANPVPCVLGNSGRNQFRGPAYVSDNVSLSGFSQGYVLD